MIFLITLRQSEATFTLRIPQSSARARASAHAIASRVSASLENQGAALPRHPWTNQCWYYYTNVDDCAGFTSFTIWVSLDHGITCTCRHRNNLLASLNISMLASSGCSRCCSDRGRMIRAVVTLWFSQIQFSQTPLLLLREDGHEGIHA